MKDDRAYYWVAVNGSSAAITGLPMRPDCFRGCLTPERLLGFRTTEEQRKTKTQRLLLNASHSEIEASAGRTS